MMKQKLGNINALYPTPTTLVGAIVNGKPNFITIAHIGIMTLTQISLGINKVHYTNAGIKENRTFSVNIPSEALVKETDYVGIVTGKKVDKSALFELFYGELKTAPMIKACSICMECRLDRIVDFESHDVFVGEIIETHVEESVLTEGRIDISKVKPILFDMPLKKYWSLGRPIADCWNIGKELKKQKT
jgi:flavin reductase (DIM6/NTAB) family NADH-FMN oxidoreductase RutF